MRQQQTIACIVMISPSSNADSVCLDMTPMYTINNAYRLGFGSIEVLNLIFLTSRKQELIYGAFQI